MNKNYSLAFILIGSILLGCDAQNSSESSPTNSNSTTTTAPTTPENTAQPVTAVSACEKLTADEVVSVYSDKKFKIETNRNDTPNIFEALSACRYQEEGKEAFDQYFVDLEIRAKQDATQAMKMLQDAKETDFNKRGKEVSGFGDSAYYFNYPMQDGGPSLAMVKGNVYYRLTIQTIHHGAFASLETEIMALAKKVLE